MYLSEALGRRSLQKCIKTFFNIRLVKRDYEKELEDDEIGDIEIGDGACEAGVVL